jgi:hypothetical protein
MRPAVDLGEATCVAPVLDGGVAIFAQAEAQLLSMRAAAVGHASIIRDLREIGTIHSPSSESRCVRSDASSGRLRRAREVPGAYRGYRRTMVRALVQGAAAGAAGTAALDAATYLDMAVRGRAPSSVPQLAVEKMATHVGADVLGHGDTRQHRVEGLSSLSGIATGVGVGAVLGLLRRAGLRPGPVAGSLLTGAIAMAAANASLVRLGVTDPRRWSATDWAADALPHLAYGVVTHATLARLDG